MALPALHLLAGERSLALSGALELGHHHRQLRRKRPKGGQRSLRDIAAKLAQRGILNERGKQFSAASINSMLLK
jgi:hypothetical protein